MRQQQSSGIMSNVNRMSRFQQFGGAAGSIMFVAFSPFIIMEGLRDETVSVRRMELPGELVAVAGAVGVVFFSICAVLYVRALFTRRP